NRSSGRWPARNARFTELIMLRKATNPNNNMRTTLVATITFCRSAFSNIRVRALSSSGFGISALLFHVPDDEDETELAHGNHEAYDNVQEREDETRSALADERHDRHDHDQEKGECHHNGDERFGEHPERLHLLPHLQTVLLLELLRLHEEIRLQLATARRGRHDTLQEVLELVRRGPLGRAPNGCQDVDSEELRVPGDPFRFLGDLSVDRLTGEFLEDDVHRDVGRGHRGNE